VGPADWGGRIQGAGWEDIARLPWIWTPPNCTFCQIALDAFESRGLQPLRVTVADQEPLIRTLVGAGIGLSIMIEEEARLTQEQGRVAIWDEVLGTVDLGFIYPRRRASDPLVKALVEGIQHVWKISETMTAS
jgi:DNA-binding transcriptional LysR family regulator